MFEISRGQIAALGEVVQFLDRMVAMTEIRGGGPGDAVYLVADPGEAVLHAGDDALDLRRAFAGILGPDRGFAAFADQIADLAIQAANRVADLAGGLTRGLRKTLHFVRHHRETS